MANSEEGRELGDEPMWEPKWHLPVVELQSEEWGVGRVLEVGTN